MANYVIGDVQGHYDTLCRLLEKINFCATTDELWFVGDLVNRGHQSLETLRFLKNLKPAVKICLGNHDLYLLHLIFNANPKNVPADLMPIIKACDKEELGLWLKSQGFLHECKQANAIIVHAGICPTWSIKKATHLALELQEFCKTDEFFLWMKHFFDKRCNFWDDQLKGLERYQVIADYFTRMRFTDYDGHLNWDNVYALNQTPANCYPWYACPSKKTWSHSIIFGHWAALQGKTGFKAYQVIDTGVSWGGTLTALKLNNFKRFSTF
jgi:bis(5'-nucleosyl)-tetraphosphatase (symmetrical)